MSQILFFFCFRLVDENYRIFVVVVVIITKISLFSSTKIFVFVIIDGETLVTMSGQLIVVFYDYKIYTDI